MIMSNLLNSLLPQWATRLRDGSRARIAKRESDLRNQLETTNREIVAASQHDAGQLRARAAGLSRENAALKTEIEHLEQTVAARQRRWLEKELERRSAVLCQWHEREEAAQSEQHLADLAQVERLLAGHPTDGACWQAGDKVWVLDSLPAKAKAEVSAAVSGPDGVVRQTLGRMAARLAAAQGELNALPSRRARLAVIEQLAGALCERLHRLEAALGEDRERSFKSEQLKAYYLDSEGDGLKSEEARQLITSALHPLCQDAVLEIALWRTHLRGELRKLTGDSPRHE